MRARWWTAPLLVAALVVLFGTVESWLAPTTRMSGVVVDVQPGRFISITNGTMDPGGVKYRMREDAAIDGDPARLRRGATVVLTYRSVGERRLVVSRVRVVEPQPATPAR